MVAPDQWGDTFMPAMMAGKLLNIAGELPEKHKIAGDKFKKIVSGDPMNGQFKNQQAFDFKPIAAQWFATNYLPTTDDISDGFNRRWLFLKFKNPIKKEEVIRDLGNDLVANEREQIVAWAVRGIERLRAYPHYTEPASHVETVQEMAVKNDSVRFFILRSGRVRIGQVTAPNGTKISPHISETDLRVAYSNYCIGDQGARRVSSLQFGQIMCEIASGLGIKRIQQEGVPLYTNLTLVA